MQSEAFGRRNVIVQSEGGSLIRGGATHREQENEEEKSKWRVEKQMGSRKANGESKSKWREEKANEE